MKTNLLIKTFFGAASLLVTSAPPLLAHPDHSESIAIEDEPDLQLIASRFDVDAPVINISLSADKRVIESNGIPAHSIGRFPNRSNPNLIRSQDYSFQVPLNPVANEKATSMQGYMFGVALNGVPFDPGTAEFYGSDRRRGWRFEAMSGAVPLGLDWNNAHVQPTGAYHYHSIPIGLLEKEEQAGRSMVLLGWAADGFPIYCPMSYRDPMNPDSEPVLLVSSYRIKSGQRPNDGSNPGGTYDGSFVEDYEFMEGLGDLDACNGRFGVTPEFPEGTYYYVLTPNYPYIPRQFKGTPDISFLKPFGGHPDTPRPGTRSRGMERGPRPLLSPAAGPTE